MNIDAIIVQLRALCPIFDGNVAGAMAYANGVKDQVWLPLPAAYVLHGEEDADENTSMGSEQQIVHERIVVVSVVETLNVGGASDPADRRGQAAAAYLDTLRASIFRAILNWRPDWNPPNVALNREARGIYYVGSTYPPDGGFDRARFFYQFIFGLDTTFSYLDGWQLPSDPLVAIRGTITNPPGDASAHFNVGKTP